MSIKSDSDASDVAKASSGVTASSTALLGADLVVVALSWDNPPSEGGIVTITFLMLISFVAFIHVMHSIMRSEFIVARLQMTEFDEKVREKDSRELSQTFKVTMYMHLTGLNFTMIAFWIISYKYLISLGGYNLVILLLPFILFLLFWFPKFFGVDPEVKLRSGESLTQLVIQIVFLILICLDFFRVLTIP